jgi:2'-5' RNA ligase
MTGRWRLFAAVEIPDDARSAIARAVDAIGDVPGLRWTPPEQLHVTLLFLGAVAPDAVPTIEGRLADVARGSAPFRMSLSGLGRFPGRGNLRVLWVGLRDDADALTALAEATKTALEDLVVTDERPFHAHITIARSRDPLRLPAGVLDTVVEPVIVDVDHLALFRSHLGESAPTRYEPLRRWHLGRATP